MDLKEMEALTTELLAKASNTVRGKKIEKRRTDLMAVKTKEAKARLATMLQKIKAQIEQAKDIVAPGDNVMVQLLQHQAHVTELINDVEPLTAAEVDAELLIEEENLLRETDEQELREWRIALKEDILETILAQNNFFGATDASVIVLDHKSHLEAIGAFQEVAACLVNQVNIVDTKKMERGGLPCVEIKESALVTLTYIANKARENRNKTGGTLEMTPIVQHRVSEAPPTQRFDSLKGRVLVIGGYTALEDKVRRRLAHSSVNITWMSVQDALRDEGLEGLVKTHEVTFLIQGYDIKKQEEALKARVSKAGEPVCLQNVGLNLVEEIAKRLRALALLKLNNGKVRVRRF